MEKNIALEELVNLTNKNLGYEPSTPTHYNELSLKILRKTAKQLSVTTIKRIWGYVQYNSFPTITTLDILAQYNGYSSWKDFIGTGIGKSQDDSGFLEDSLVNVEELSYGDRVELSWARGKGCELEYLGGERFRVLNSINIKLQPEDVVRLQSVCKGHPLYVSEIVRGEERLPNYIGAKKGGVEEVTIVHR